MTDMKMGAYGYRYILTIVDHYSRFTDFVELRTRNTEEVCRNFQDYLSDFGTPDVLFLDNAKEFMSAQFKDLCITCNVQFGYIIPYHPQGNSISERMHRTMKSVLSNT